MNIDRLHERVDRLHEGVISLHEGLHDMLRQRVFMYIIVGEF